MSVPFNLADDESISLPIRTFHMICERLSTIEEQNRELKESLIRAEHRKLGHLDAQLLGFGNIEVDQYYLRDMDFDEHWGNHCSYRGDCCLLKEHNFPAHVDLHRISCVIGFRTGKMISPGETSKRQELILEELGISLNDSVKEDAPVSAFPITNPQRPTILDEALWRRTQKAFPQSHVKFEYVQTSEGMRWFSLLSKRRFMTDISAAIRALFPAVEALGISATSIKQIRIVHLRFTGRYLDLLRLISKNPPEYIDESEQELMEEAYERLAIFLGHRATVSEALARPMSPD